MKPPSRYSRSLEIKQQGTASSVIQAGQEDCVGEGERKMRTLRIRMNLNPVLMCQDKAWWKHAASWDSGATLLQREVHFQSLCTAVQYGELPWQVFVNMAQEMPSVIWEDRLLRHPTAKLQSYYRACMKHNVFTSINGWHLDRSTTETLTLRLAFCKVLSPSSRMEERDCSGLKNNVPANGNIFTQPAPQRCCRWTSLLSWAELTPETGKFCMNLVLA